MLSLFYLLFIEVLTESLLPGYYLSRLLLSWKRLLPPLGWLIGLRILKLSTLGIEGSSIYIGMGSIGIWWPSSSKDLIRH